MGLMVHFRVIRRRAAIRAIIMVAMAIIRVVLIKRVTNKTFMHPMDAQKVDLFSMGDS
jgi:hypothetical protein